MKHLEIDHIYDDGAEERTKYGSSDKIYGWYLEHQDLAFRRLQPLCKEHHEDKHHPLIEQWSKLIPDTKPKQKYNLFNDIIKKLQGDNQLPVKEEILIKELVKHDPFNFPEEPERYIRKMLREAFIYEAKPDCYLSLW